MWRRQYNPFYLWQQQREKQQQLKAAERERDSILHEFRGIKRKINLLDVTLPYIESYEKTEIKFCNFTKTMEKS